MIIKMAGLAQIEFADSKPDNSVQFISGTENYYIPLEETIDTAAVKTKLEEDLKYQQGFIGIIMKKLGNERFVANAPEAVVAKERQKMADAEERIRIIEDQLSKM